MRTLAKASDDFYTEGIVDKDIYFFLLSNEHKNTQMPPNAEICWQL